jgi:hypothetical protein
VFQLDVTGLGATGVDGGLEYGGGAAARWFVLPRVSVRLGGGARTGSVPAADASLLTLLATAGVALHPWRATASHPLGMSVRVDYLLANQQMTHFSGDEPAPVTISRWLSGLDGLVEGQWFFARDIGLIAGVGAEDVFGTTTVSMRGPLVASIPPLRGVGEIGLLISF